MAWVTDDIFVAGGDFVSEQWPDFCAQTETRAIITLSPEKPGTFLDPLPWAVLWLPVAAEAAWTLAQLQLGVLFIETARAAQQRILLHAAQGLHRTRPLVAAQLLAQGKSLARVLRELEQKPWLPPYKGQVPLLEQWLTHLKDSSSKIQDSKKTKPTR